VARGRGVVRLIAALVAVATLAYPVLIYLGLTRFSARWLGLAVLGVAVAGLAIRLRRRAGTTRPRMSGVIVGSLGVVCLAALSAGSNNATFVLFVPVLISLSLLLTFGITLRQGSVPLIERFARLQEPELTGDEVQWCRSWTVVWCLFFVVNGLTALTLAIAAPPSWWAAYSGGLAYVLIGALAAVEYVARKARFGRLGPGPIDRMLARFLPPPKLEAEP
jgi:uncharacterized membrane protein